MTRPDVEVMREAPAYGIIDPDYARVFTVARCIAWAEGYALLMHGSFTRDLDLLAVPWTEQATDAEHLVRRIGLALEDLDLLVKDPKAPSQATVKPHARRAWTFTFKTFGDPRFVDLSVMPRDARPVADGGAESRAASDVLAERRRQVEAEGWTPEHDDRHQYSALATAAACYIRQGRYCYPEEGKPGPDWPWAPEWWKPAGYRRNLVKAGALIIAEIERLDRADPPTPATAPAAKSTGEV